MGNKRSAVLATIQQLKEGQHLVATMVAGIQKFWADAEKKEAAQKAKEEETSSAQKGGRSKKKIVRK